eukprot:CAMPEP_0113530230 /NCGR_PEP_ID=MMETSP0015_2-20120614/2821_1 /TAXON_ID=2838 /ORGANISM="Odontella" /LENGTH=469 /DNA_ID=CAMNT_0000428923 /DNA_START=443 /DNA_END=1852 /DNA_ORIENTATION=+ /assembly_acc=CAM_ASM_000160
MGKTKLIPRWARKGRKSKRKSNEHFGVVDLDADSVDPRREAGGKHVVITSFPLAGGDPNAGGGLSLGSGVFPENGPVLFHPAPPPTICSNWSTASNFSGSGNISISDEEENHLNGGSSRGLLKSMKSKSKDIGKELKVDILSIKKDIAGMARVPISFVRKKSLFLRTADLVNLDHPYEEGTRIDLHPHYHRPSSDTPHDGVDHDPKEEWVALDTGEGTHAPVAPYAVDALAKSGFDSAMNRSMWTLNRPSEKILARSAAWSAAIWQMKGKVRVPPRGSADENDVLVWSGNFTHGLYGSDLPTVRAEGVVNMAPSALVDLLLDNSRVYEYNKMSLGRDDVLVLQDDLENDGPFGQSITKVVRSASKPPLVRKSLEFVTLMHVRKLEDGNGYLIVSRAVTQAEEAINSDGKVMRSEILMGVNIIRNVEGDNNRAIMINVNHIRSPMIPMMIAKKIGLSAAVGFFTDLRALC